MPSSLLELSGPDVEQKRSGSGRPIPFRAEQAPSRPRAAELGTARLIESMAQAGPALLVPIALAATLLPFFWTTPQRIVILGVLAALCALGLVVLAGCRFAATRASASGAAAIGNRIAAALALLTGSAWAALPILLYADADSGQQLILVATLCGAIGNVCLLGSASPAGLLYVTPLLSGGVFGLAAGGDAESVTLALLLLAGAVVIGFVLDRNRKLASIRIRDRLEVHDQAFTIDRLLLDFEETANDWLWETDANCQLRHVAPHMAEATGLRASDLDGTLFKTILRSAPRWAAGGDGTSAVLEAMKVREPFRNIVVAVDTPRGLVWWRLSGKPILDSHGRFTGFRGIGTDVTETRNAQARIAYLADHDACTGLPNRVSFRAHALKECVAATEGRRGGALLSLDLDGFKAVNDRLGHAAGDEVLKEVARRLIAQVPPEAMVARLGGDEFAIWYPTSVPEKAMTVASDLIEAIRLPFTLRDGAHVEIGASVGIAMTPKHAGDADLLLVRADLSLYRAKAEGKGLARLFVEAYERSIIEQRTLEADLKLALARQEFELYYQPILDVRAGKVVCFETLIRWTSPTRGFVSPADFIPAAETAGLIVDIDRWVLRRACKDATTWPDDVDVAINVSPDHFRTADLLHDVRIALHLSGLDPRRLLIEVTEGVFLDTSASALETLHALRRLGVRIALDDFGTGYSSLSYLINFPIDEIKIDRSFVRDFIDRLESRAVIDAILSLARRLDIKVVAEGIETREQALALKLRRCDQIQGYLLSRPQPRGAVETMLAEVPILYRDAVPTHVDSALGMALARKKHAI